MARIILIGAAALIAIAGHAVQAQPVKGTVLATNGVTVSTNLDEFAARYEYTAPRIEFRSAKGAVVSARVAKIRGGERIGPAHVQGFVIYTGDWRHYDSAVFRGGGQVDFQKTDARVGECTYRCSLSEFFTILLSPAEIAKHSEKGIVPIQIRSRDGDTALLEVPLTYLDAVNEVAK